jgi:hypothetical protein
LKQTLETNIYTTEIDDMIHGHRSASPLHLWISPMMFTTAPTPHVTPPRQTPGIPSSLPLAPPSLMSFEPVNEKGFSTVYALANTTQSKQNEHN